MAEKDASSKQLFSIDEVFADAFNGLQFGGAQVIDPKGLSDASSSYPYIFDGTLHSQERDIVKFYKNTTLHMTMLGIEHQSTVTDDMPLRRFGYDGAVYAMQAQRKLKYEERFPVISIVLNISDREWKNHLTLADCMHIDDVFRPYVFGADAKLPVYNLRFLDQSTINTFRTECGAVAHVLGCGQRQEPLDLNLGNLKNIHLKYTDQLANFLKAHDAGGVAAALIKAQLEKKKGEDLSMLDVLEYSKKPWINEGIEIGRAQGFEDGRNEGIGKIAMKMYQKGEKYKDIAEYTGYDQCTLDALAAEQGIIYGSARDNGLGD